MGQEGIQQAYQQFMQEIQQQQAQKAKFGAKLNYIKGLNGQCPEGTEMQYFKEGGNICKKCVAKQKNGDKEQDLKRSASDKERSRSKDYGDNHLLPERLLVLPSCDKSLGAVLGRVDEAPNSLCTGLSHNKISCKSQFKEIRKAL